MSSADLPLGWREVQFGDICTLRTDMISPSSSPDMPYVGLEHIDSGNPRLSRHGVASEVKSAKSRFYPDDILYGKLRPYLDKAVRAELTGMCSTDILVFRPNALVTPGYLVYLVHTDAFLKHAIRATKGVNHPRTSWSALSQFTFPLPSIPEQKAIARTLWAVQEAKDHRARELELEKERRAALMEHLFTYGTRGEPTKKTETGEIPERWQIVPLDQCAVVQTGVAKGRRLSGRTMELPYLRVANVQDGYLDLSEMKTITLLEREVDRYLLRSGDIVLTEGGDFDKLGRGFLWSGEIETCVHQNHVFAVRVDEKRLVPRFLAYQFGSGYGKAYFLSVAHKTTNLACINTSKLKGFPVLIPPKDEQVLIAEILLASDNKISGIAKEIGLLDELFMAMLEELMTGRLSAVPLIETEGQA